MIAVVIVTGVLSLMCLGHEQHYALPQYSYEYQVSDQQTGDMKSAREIRLGDFVRGFYTMKEADGTMRVVHYTSDKDKGFQAEVRRIGLSRHPVMNNKHYV